MRNAAKSLLVVLLLALVSRADVTVDLPQATVTIPYVVQLSFKGFVGAMPFVVTVENLPAGATFDAQTGIFSATFPAATDVTFIVDLTDANKNVTKVTSKIHVVAAAAIQMDAGIAKLPPATVGQPYNVPISPSGIAFPGPYTLAAANLPAGLALAGNNVSGTPTAANPAEGDYAIQITVHDAGGVNAASRSATLHLFLHPQVVAVSAPTCSPTFKPKLVGTLKDGSSTITGQASVPKGCTATIAVIDADDGTILPIKSGATVDATGNFIITLTDPLQAGQKVYLDQYLLDSSGAPAGTLLADRAAADSVAIGAFEVQGFGDWGRVRAYFTGGILLSQNQGSFSQSSLFLSFLLDKTWHLPPYYNDSKWLPGFNTFFETRLTSIPVTVCPSSSTTTSATSPCAGTSFNTFLTSQKAARLDVGGYFPYTLTTWNYRHRDNALFWAPLAKVGFDTPTSPINQTQAQGQSGSAGNNASASVTPVNNNNFYNFYGYGFRTGHYSLPKSTDLDHAPELISHLDFIVGRFSNLETFLQGPNNTVLRTRLYRISMEGLLKIPFTPVSIGFSSNVGQIALGRGNSIITQRAGDDLRFFFGTKFDVGKLMDQLKNVLQ